MSETWARENCIIKRQFLIKSKFNFNERRIINQFQVINWPDHMEPEKQTGYATIEQILLLMQENICYYPKSPIFLHCR